MNVYAVIPTHERKEITSINIKLLLRQGIKIILVVSSEHERRFYSGFPIEVILRQNRPLGYKWQEGVNYARNLSPDYLIILGSDDILSNDFAQKYCNDWLFVGFKSFWSYSGAKLLLVSYLVNQCIGGGRVFHKDLLDAIEWKIFDTSRDKLLDDKASEISTNFAKCIEIRYPEVLAIKGNWATLNPFVEKHKNIKVIKTLQGSEAKKLMAEKFSYDC